MPPILTRREAILAGTLAFAGAASAAGKRKTKRTRTPSVPPKPKEIPPLPPPDATALAQLPRELNDAELNGLRTTFLQQRRDMAVPGASLVGIREGRIEWRLECGAAKAGGPPVDAFTRWQAASLTKPMFAYLVLKLCEEGRLALDMPLRIQYPDYESLPLSRTPGAESITPRMVLAHESGMPLTHMPEFPEDLDFAPGSQFGYSGAAYIYLQKVVERITGQPLDALMQQRIIEPMKLEYSTLVWPTPFEQRMAAAYELNNRPCSQPSKPTKPNAAGSLHTTALDYAAFICQAFLNQQSDTLRLSPRFERMMFSPQVPLPGASTLAWGLGWGLMLDRNNNDVFMHFGSSRGFESYAAGQLDDGTALVGFANKRGSLRLLSTAAREILGPSQDEIFRWIYTEFYKGEQGSWPPTS